MSLDLKEGDLVTVHTPDQALELSSRHDSGERTAK
jgi:hypothetical protein